MHAGLVAIAFVVLIASCGERVPAGQEPIPTPIGRGASYQPAARSSFRCEARPSPLASGKQAHLELFANDRVVIIPGGVGVRGARWNGFGRIRAARCHAALWTLDPTGVVSFRRSGLLLGDFFAVWNSELSERRLLSFRARPSERLLMFRNGTRWRGDPHGLPLQDGDQIVLELNGYVPPHRSYLFPPLQP